jgi:hypothetical protein
LRRIRARARREDHDFVAASGAKPRFGLDAPTAFADYALCMVGPTGPSLLRDNPVEFRSLGRRRLASACARQF